MALAVHTASDEFLVKSGIVVTSGNYDSIAANADMIKITTDSDPRVPPPPPQESLAPVPRGAPYL
jgi:hypothetical protein